MTDSDENFSEDGKRKNPDNLHEIFSRSKKVFRTPDKSNTKMNTQDNQEEMKELLRQLTAENKKKNEELEDIRNMLGDVVQELKEIRKENSEYKKQMKEIILENENLKKEMANMKQKMDKIEITLEICQKDMKKNNLIMKGLPIDTADTELLKNTVETFIGKELGIETEINRTQKINNMMCVIEFKKFEDKLKVLRAKSKLTNYKPHRVYIECDLTLKEIDMQKNLRNIAVNEKANGRKTKIGYGFIIIEDKKWKWNQNTNTLEKATNNIAATHSKN